MALAQGRSTAFLSSGFCCSLWDHGEITARLRLGSALGIDPDTDHSQLATGAPLTRLAPRSNASNGDPTNPIAELISIDYIDMI